MTYRISDRIHRFPADSTIADLFLLGTINYEEFKGIMDYSIISFYIKNPEIRRKNISRLYSLLSECELGELISGTQRDDVLYIQINSYDAGYPITLRICELEEEATPFMANEDLDPYL